MPDTGTLFDTAAAVRADWPALKRLFAAVKADRDAGRFDAARWHDFLAACAHTEARPPYHLRAIVEALVGLAGGKERAALRIVDHGCGSGMNLLYLHALGFAGARGVNVTRHCLAWNEWLRAHAGYGDDVFLHYDGSRLPFADGSQDLLYSQQVVEHVEPAVVDAYYREAGRVLREGGIAIHQAPHRLTPYDSHTRTWFLHWLPRRAQLAGYRLFRRDAGWAARELFLRRPGHHRRNLRHWIGPFRNLTRHRLATLKPADIALYYDGPARLRRILARAATLPALGPALAAATTPWLMAETVATKDSAYAAAARPRRRVLFLLSEHVIDFDTYLPVAMALKAARPEWSLRFVTFSRGNADFIRANPTLAEGLARCGELIVRDPPRGGKARRRAGMLGAFAGLARWLAARRGSVVFHGRNFSEAPYAALFLANRAAGGRGIVLARSRQPDAGVKLNIRPRFESFAAHRSRVERVFGRDHDRFVHYHDAQELYLRTQDQWGRIDPARKLSMGLPHLLPEWRALLAAEVAKARAEFARDGGEIYAVFAPKSFSSKYLRLPDSAERSFRLVIEALRDLRPGATVLVRAHPRAIGEPWLAETIAAVAHPHLAMTLLHPEVLCALAARTIAPNTTTTMLIAADGRFIDCTDYAADHYAAMGERSLCDGYNTIFVNPARDDFRARFAEALGEGPWAQPGLARERDALLARNPPRLDLLLSAIEDRAR